MDSLTQAQKNLLVAEHARLTAQFVQGNAGAKKQLVEIEERLNLTPVEIARLAKDSYLKDY